MKIELRPDGILMSIFTRAAVATGRTAGLSTEEFWVREFRWFFLGANRKQEPKRSPHADDFFYGSQT